MVSFHKWRQEKNFHDQSQFFHIDNPFPMTKNHNNKLRDPERAPTSYPPSTASSTGFSISSQMLNSTLPIPLPTRPTAPGTPFDSTIVWTHFEMESSKKVVNKSGMFGTHKPTFIPIIMNLKFKKLCIHRKKWQYWITFRSPPSSVGHPCLLDHTCLLSNPNHQCRIDHYIHTMIQIQT